MRKNMRKWNKVGKQNKPEDKMRIKQGDGRK